MGKSAYSIAVQGMGELIKKANLNQEAVDAALADISPQSRGDVVDLYVSPEGNDDNDGLSLGNPFKTIQKALDTLANDRRGYSGKWTIHLASGTYTEGAILDAAKARDYRFRILGPSVGLNSEPLAIIDGTGASRSDGLFFFDVGQVEISNVKIQNFSKGAGVRFNNTGLVRLTNVHVSNCDSGYFLLSDSFYQVTGGIIDSCYFGIQELFHIVRNFKTVSSVADGLKIRNCTYGIHAKEHCTGHMDFTTIEDCEYGFAFSRSCTANSSDGVVRRNGHGAVLRSGSYLAVLRMDWGLGTANKNTVPWLVDHSSGFVVGELSVETPFRTQGEKVMGLFADPTPATLTGTTTGTTMVSNLGRIMAGSLVSPGTYCRFIVIGRRTGSGTITLGVTIGGSTGPSVTIPASQTPFKFEGWMISTGEDTQIVFGVTEGSGANVASSKGDRTYPLSTTSQVVAIRGTLTNISDSLIIDAAFAYTTDVVGPVGY